MPLKLQKPAPGRSPNYRIRGTYLGQLVDQSTGTPERRVAAQALAKLKEDIELGRFTRRADLTFLDAANAYMEAGGERRFVGAYDEETQRWSGLLAKLGATPVRAIDQALVDKVASELYPAATPATRNRQVHTVISAILKHAGIEGKLKRPKGANGGKRTQWLWPEQAEAIFTAAEKIDQEFAVFLVTLCYTGLRLSEATFLQVSMTRLDESFSYVANTKNDDPRAVYLPPDLLDALASHPRGMDRPGEAIFRFRKNGRLYKLLAETKKAASEAAGEDLNWVTFHTFRHTWATWMRRYGKLDTRGLVGTGAWRDPKAAARYQHTVVTEEAMKAVALPRRKKGG